jgi:hypothetical protein
VKIPTFVRVMDTQSPDIAFARTFYCSRRRCSSFARVGNTPFLSRQRRVFPKCPAIIDGEHNLRQERESPSAEDSPLEVYRDLPAAKIVRAPQPER